MRQFVTVPRLGFLAVLLSSAIGVGCNPCRFGYLRGVPITGATAGAVGCCGAFVRLEATVDDKSDYKIQLSNIQIPGLTNRVDAWLTDDRCNRLFESPYPASEDGRRAVPRCRVISGPVSPGSVDPPIRVSPGTYRIFLQAWSTNTDQAPYQISLGLWARVCDPIGYGPTY